MSDLNTVTTSNLSATCPKSVLITGASSGIGRELALQYANDGYQVIACGQNNQKLVALMAEHPAIEALVFDVTESIMVRWTHNWSNVYLPLMCLALPIVLKHYKLDLIVTLAIAYLTYSYALDVKEKGIFVSLVSPGFVKTPLTDKNDFAMPMLMSVSDAAQSIRAGITAKKTEIHFPAKFTYWLKLMALLPVNIQQWMVRKMTRRSS